MDKKQLTKLASQFDALAALMTDISGTFRGGESDGADEGGDATPDKPVRGSRSRAKPATKAKAESEIDEDAIREKLSELAEKHGKEQVVAALAEVGAGRLSDVDPGDYEALSNAIDVLLESEAQAKPARRSRKAAKPAGPTYDDVEAKFKELVDADLKAAKAVLAELGVKKLSMIDQEDEGTLADAMAAINEALEEEGGLV